MLLKNKIAIVTGASAGIGKAIALHFARQGAKLILNARHEKKLVVVAKEITDGGGQAEIIIGDVAREETQDALVDCADKTHGALHVAANNAGMVGEISPLIAQSTENWRRVLDVNLSSAFFAAQRQIPLMLESGGGSLIFTSSFVGNSAGIPGMSAYGTAKAGLSGLVRGIAADYGSAGIRANALLAGGTDTAMAGNEDQKKWAAGLHAMKRIAEPREIAEAAVFLASDMSSFVTGTELYADGGNSAVK